jgi:hypothetical protein
MNVPDVSYAAKLQSRFATPWFRVEDTSTSGVGFADRGTLELKGPPGEWRWYAVNSD